MADPDRTPISVEMAPPLRVSWVGHLVRSLLTLGLYDYWRLWDPKMMYQSRVVAVNDRGQHFTLFGVADPHEARDKLERIRRELDELPLDVWCRCYLVPGEFVDGSWRPGRLGHEGLSRRWLDPDS